MNGEGALSLGATCRHDEGEAGALDLATQEIRKNGPSRDELRRSTLRRTDPWHTPPSLWRRLKPEVRRMRRNSTSAEDKLWQRLRRHQVGGLKFRPQHFLGRFVVDFYCGEASLVIEVDSPVHDGLAARDALRQEYIEALGFTVLRFTNHEIENSLETVLDSIREAL